MIRSDFLIVLAHMWHCCILADSRLIFQDIPKLRSWVAKRWYSSDRCCLMLARSAIACSIRFTSDAL